MPKDSYPRRELTHHWEEIGPLLQNSAQITYEISRKRGRRACIIIVGSLLTLLFTIWLPTSASMAQQLTPHNVHGAGAISLQETPTVDPTVTALEKEKLEHDNDWLWNFGATLLSTLALVIAGVFGIVRWFGDRQAEREKQQEAEKRLREERRVEQEKRDEERFQTIVAGLGSANSAAQVGAAILLRTFLQPGYEKFYSQVFDLAVVYLRLRHVDPQAPEPLDSLSQALITVFKESFPLARDYLQQSPQFLDATYIQLDNALLKEADLQYIYMPEAYLREANIRGINLRGAEIRGTDFFNTSLHGANLSEAIVFNASLRKARLNGANLLGADLTGADLTEADLSEVNLTGADLNGANLSRAKVTQEQLDTVQSLEGVTMPDGSTPHGTSIDPN